MDTMDMRPRMLRAVHEAVDRARMSNGIMRLHETTHRILSEQNCAPEMETLISDALCAQSIRQGLAIEFAAPADHGLRAPERKERARPER